MKAEEHCPGPLALIPSARIPSPLIPRSRTVVLRPRDCRTSCQTRENDPGRLSARCLLLGSDVRSFLYLHPCPTDRTTGHWNNVRAEGVPLHAPRVLHDLEPTLLPLLVPRTPQVCQPHRLLLGHRVVETPPLGSRSQGTPRGGQAHPCGGRYASGGIEMGENRATKLSWNHSRTSILCCTLKPTDYRVDAV